MALNLSSVYRIKELYISNTFRRQVWIFFLKK